MIYTFTPNPAIDMNITTHGIERKKVNRTFNTLYTPNGKGLNVSFVLNHFGLDSKILGFFGGFSGKYIVEESQNRGFEVFPTWVEDTTRINIFLNDGDGEFKFVNAGSFVPKEKQEAMLTTIRNLHDIHYLSISGSLPPGIDAGFYDEIVSICKGKNVRLIWDISAPKLKELLAAQPFLIKPNDEEIEEIFGIRMENEQDIVATLHMLHQMGAQNILLTLGEKGAYFFNGRNIYYSTAQKITLLSSACAGDASLAGFMSIWLQNPDAIEKALVRSAAVGANVAESNGLGDFNNVVKYAKNIKVRKVE